MQKEMPRETTFKCPSCDGVMSVDTRFCPYCGWENAEAVRRETEIKEVEAEFQRKEPLIKLKSINRVMNIILTAVIAVFCLWFVGVIVFFIGYNAKLSIQKKTNMEEMQAQMECLYEAGKYNELYEYVYDHDLYDETDEKYKQVMLRVYKYDWFWDAAERYLETKEQPQEYAYREDTVEYVLYYADFLYKDNVQNEEATPENQKIFAEWTLETDTFLKTYLYMTEEEIEALKNRTLYDMEDEAEQDAFISLLEERIDAQEK